MDFEAEDDLPFAGGALDQVLSVNGNGFIISSLAAGGDSPVKPAQVPPPAGAERVCPLLVEGGRSTAARAAGRADESGPLARRCRRPGGEVDGDGEDVVQIHLDRIVGLSPMPKAAEGDVDGRHAIDIFEGLGEVVGISARTFWAFR